MKRIIAAVCAVCVLGGLSEVFAHPTSDIVFNYYAPTKTLTLVIRHDVSLFPSSHYIKLTSVALNGKQVITQEALAQASVKYQYASYFIVNLKPGDKIMVDTVCSLSGNFKKEYVVQE